MVKQSQKPHGANKRPAREKPVEELNIGELRNELIKKRGGPDRQAALKREFQRRVGARGGRLSAAVSAAAPHKLNAVSNAPPHKLNDRQLRAEIRRGGASADRLDALYAELERRKKSKCKVRNPQNLPVHELTASELRSELKRPGNSPKRSQQLKRELMHRRSGFVRTRVVSGGAPGLGKRRGK